MTITYQREKLAAVRPELPRLMQLHWDEVAHHKDCRVLDPDWQQFELLEKNGQLLILTARDESADGALIGYMGAFIRPHLHSRGLLTGYVDAIFLDPTARRNSAGVRLCNLTDLALNSMVDFIYWHVKPERDFSTLLKRQGCAFIEGIWGRPTSRLAGGNT